MMKKTFPAQARLCSLAFCFSALASLSVAQPAIVDVDVQGASDEALQTEGLQGDINNYGTNSFNEPVGNAAAAPTAERSFNQPAGKPGYMKPVHPIATMPDDHPKKQVVQPQSQGELFYQLQLLQEEVMQLRGQFEQQQLELQRLKQQRMDDYLMMDRRMSAIEQGGAANTGTPTYPSSGTAANAGADAAASSSSGAASSNTSPVSSASADSAYKAAYGLIKSRELDQAELAFEQFLVDYPQSPLRANAYYWLGELYDRKGALDKARAAFIQVLEQYPDSNKVPDALYKLGKVYHRLGNNEKALEYLEAVIARYGNTSRTSVRQAQEYLKNNFSGNG